MDRARMSDAEIVVTIQWCQRVLANPDIPSHMVGEITELNEEAFNILEGRYGALNVEIDPDMTMRIFAQDDQFAWVQLSDKEAI